MKETKHTNTLINILTPIIYKSHIQHPDVPVDIIIEQVCEYYLQKADRIDALMADNMANINAKIKQDKGVIVSRKQLSAAAKEVDDKSSAKEEQANLTDKQIKERAELVADKSGTKGDDRKGVVQHFINKFTGQRDEARGKKIGNKKTGIGSRGGLVFKWTSTGHPIYQSHGKMDKLLDLHEHMDHKDHAIAAKELMNHHRDNPYQKDVAKYKEEAKIHQEASKTKGKQKYG